MTCRSSNFVVFQLERKRGLRGTAFTLLEMLLVLAILLAITTVTIPVVGRMYDTQRIQQAAIEMRTTLSAARLRAVDHGEVFECRIEPEGRHLVVLPRRDQGIRFGSDESQPATANRRPATGIHVALPEPLYFWTADSFREQLAAPALRDLIDGETLSDRSWSAPMVFAANGTSSDRSFEIRDQAGRAVQIDVRGLTGAARASKVMNRSVP